MTTEPDPLKADDKAKTFSATTASKGEGSEGVLRRFFRRQLINWLIDSTVCAVILLIIASIFDHFVPERMEELKQLHENIDKTVFNIKPSMLLYYIAYPTAPVGWLLNFLSGIIFNIIDRISDFLGISAMYLRVIPSLFIASFGLGLLFAALVVSMLLLPLSSGLSL